MGVSVPNRGGDIDLFTEMYMCVYLLCFVWRHEKEKKGRKKEKRKKKKEKEKKEKNNID